MSNPNIYQGDKNQYKKMTIEVKIPEGLTEDETREFMSNVYLTISRGNSFVPYKKGLKAKTIAIQNVLTKGWE